MIYRSSSSTATRKFGARLARMLVRKRQRHGGALVLTLSGELGSGKTTFVYGFARGLGARGRVQSPTFIIVRRMPVSGKGLRARGKELKAKSEERNSKQKLREPFALRPAPFANLYHVDAYRIRGRRELSAIGLREVLRDPRAIIVVEWPEQIRHLLPRRAIQVVFHHGKRENERTIELRNTKPLRMYERVKR